MQQLCSLTLPLTLSYLSVTSERIIVNEKAISVTFYHQGTGARKLKLYAVNLLLLFVLDMVVKCVEWLPTLWPACKIL